MKQHYTSIRHDEIDHKAALCACRLKRDVNGRVLLYQCALHEAATDLVRVLKGFVVLQEEADQLYLNCAIDKKTKLGLYDFAQQLLKQAEG